MIIYSTCKKVDNILDMRYINYILDMHRRSYILDMKTERSILDMHNIKYILDMQIFKRHIYSTYIKKIYTLHANTNRPIYTRQSYKVLQSRLW